MIAPDEVLTFWLDEVGPAGWYKQSEELDEKVQERFLAAWEKGQEGGYSLWLTYATGTLAYCILMDQFPRNMFRGDRRSFASDAAALAAAKMAISRDWDMKIDEPARQFFYMPLMHSENLSDQDRCVRLMLTRMKETGADNLHHAKVHREIVRRFGRFPYRNEALGRNTTKAEAAFIEKGGYGALLRTMSAEGAE
ncbi:DUF924 family protein [Roseitranquillus sediminis]|uniref:DUF924 family protein n=1 Tax=Roseitranquillus sediminis TaxID=2809051 RepID=UPI001D0C18E2|nr:DUF924 family protein [Roseitranquillus sediminis]MBM9595367.1 DUF924 domain-containing protein [Roseitranquillus sediminis]